MLRLLHARRPATPWRTLLAAAMGVIALGMIAMHLLSAGHQLALPDEVSPHGHGPAAMPASGQVAAEHHHDAALDPADQAAATGAPSPVDHGVGQDDGCGAGCGHTGMLFGSCLLAFTFGLLWRLLAPRPARPYGQDDRALFRFVSGQVGTGGATDRRLALTHRELSICRT